MERELHLNVFDKTGRRGTLGDSVTDPDTRSHYETIVLENGQPVLVLSSLLVRREDGSIYVPVDLDALQQRRQRRGNGATSSYNASETKIIDGDELVVPVIEEELEVGKRTVERVVRVHKYVRETEQEVSQSLLREAVEIERVPINQVVDAAEGVRREGDVVIVPVYEEIVVVEKRLVLKEEIRMRISQHSEDWHDRVLVRHEAIEIEREAGG